MVDPFRILGLPRRFDLTPAEVSAAHLRVVAKLHPDRASDPIERDRLVNESAAAGAAKQRLFKDTFRAEELIELLGARPLLGRPLAPAFLMETMELREEIESAMASNDPAAVAGARHRVASLRAEAIADLHSAFAGCADALGCAAPSNGFPSSEPPPAGVADPSAQSAASRAATALVRLRYFDRMSDRLDGRSE